MALLDICMGMEKPTHSLALGHRLARICKHHCCLARYHRNWNELSIELLLSITEPLIKSFSSGMNLFVTFAGRREYFIQIVETVAYRLDNSGM